MKSTIYLDSASGSRERPARILQEMAGASLQPESRGNAFDDARALTAELFGISEPANVFFTKNATEALAIVIKNFMRYGDMALTTVYEHESVLRPLVAVTGEAERLSKDYYFRSRMGGSPITGFAVCGAKRDGSLDYEELRRSAIRKRPRLIVCTHASPLTGDVIDLELVGKIAKECGARFVVDAAQTAGIFEIDLEKMGIDAVCFSGHKALLGPEGIGGFAVRDAAMLRPPAHSSILGGAAASRTSVSSSTPSGAAPHSQRALSPIPGDVCSAGTPNFPGIAGFHAALRYQKLVGMRSSRTQQLARARMFYEGVRDIPGIRLYGNFEDYRRAPIVALNLESRPSEAVAAVLKKNYGILVSGGSHCAPLHARELGIEKRGAVRFSFSQFTTEDEVQTAVAALAEIAGGGGG